MAYVSKDLKAKIVANLKAIPALKAYKYSLAVRNHSTVVMTVYAGPLDLIGNYNTAPDPYRGRYGDKEAIRDALDVNSYRYREHFHGPALDLMLAVFGALNTDNHDRSDSQTDYFDVGHYVRLCIGTWDRPYRVTACTEA